MSETNRPRPMSVPGMFAADIAISVRRLPTVMAVALPVLGVLIAAKAGLFYGMLDAYLRQLDLAISHPTSFDDPGDMTSWMFRMQGEMATSLARQSLYQLFEVLGWAVANPLLAGALTLVVAGSALGVRVGFAGAWRGALRKWLQLILTESVKAVGLFVVMLVSIFIAAGGGGLVTAFFGAIFAGSPLGTALTIFVGTFLIGGIAFGPVVYLYLSWLFTVPMIVFEDADLTGAFGRSWELTRRNLVGGVFGSPPWRLTGLLTLVGLVLLAGALVPFLPWVEPAIHVARSLAAGDTTVLAALAKPDPALYWGSVGLRVLTAVALAAVMPGAIMLYYLDTRARMAGGGSDLRERIRALCGTDDTAARPGIGGLAPSGSPQESAGAPDETAPSGPSV